MKKVSCLYKAVFPLETAATSHLSQLAWCVSLFSFLTDLTTGVSLAFHSLQILGFTCYFPYFEGAENSSEWVNQTCRVPLGRKYSHAPYLLLFIGVTLPMGSQVALPT